GSRCWRARRGGDLGVDGGAQVTAGCLKLRITLAGGWTGERSPVLFSEAHAMNDDVDQLCRTIKTLVAEGDKAKAEAEQFYIAARRVLACSSCGATTDAACDCGV